MSARPLAWEATSGARAGFARVIEDVTSAESNGRLDAQGQPVGEWLSEPKTADNELALLIHAAARIRSARIITQQQQHKDQELESTSPSAVELWERIVAHAAREAARVSAQLAHIGLDIGSIAVVRRTAGNAAVKTLELFFRDGEEIRRPGLVIARFRDGSVHYEWTGRELEPGELDLSKELSPQLRRLILGLCDHVAQGYADEADAGPVL